MPIPESRLREDSATRRGTNFWPATPACAKCEGEKIPPWLAKDIADSQIELFRKKYPDAKRSRLRRPAPPGASTSSGA